MTRCSRSFLEDLRKGHIRLCQKSPHSFLMCSQSCGVWTHAIQNYGNCQKKKKSWHRRYIHMHRWLLAKEAWEETSPVIYLSPRPLRIFMIKQLPQGLWTSGVLSPFFLFLDGRPFSSNNCEFPLTIIIYRHSESNNAVCVCVGGCGVLG